MEKCAGVCAHVDDSSSAQKQISIKIFSLDPSVSGGQAGNRLLDEPFSAFLSISASSYFSTILRDLLHFFLSVYQFFYYSTSPFAFLSICLSIFLLFYEPSSCIFLSIWASSYFSTILRLILHFHLSVYPFFYYSTSHFAFLSICLPVSIFLLFYEPSVILSNCISTSLRSLLHFYLSAFLFFYYFMPPSAFLSVFLHIFILFCEIFSILN
jgi:hypothetical protein